METPLFHIDLDAFFASVVIRDHPELEAQPVIIGPDPNEGHWRGVAVTCNYPARKFGIRSGMAVSKAFRLCPNALFLHPSFSEISRLSKAVMEIIQDQADTFQQTGLDEAYFTTIKKFDSWEDVIPFALSLQNAVQQQCRLPCSIGISFTRALAKIATDLHKPRGVTVISPENRGTMLKPLELNQISGVGKKSFEMIKKKGYITFQDILTKSLSHVEHDLGRIGRYIWLVAFGKTTSSIESWGGRKSIGKEKTFSTDFGNPEQILEKLQIIGEKVQSQLLKKGLQYRTVTLKIRFAPFKTFVKSHTFPAPVRDPVIGYQKTLELFQSFLPLQKRVRLVGIRYSNLSWGELHTQSNLGKWIGPV